MTLPSGWAVARVDELAGVNGLVTDGDWVESRDQDATGGVRLTQLADIGDGAFRDRSRRYMNFDTAERLRCTFLESGDALIARMPDPIGRACLFPGLDQPAVTAVDVMVWRTDGDLATADWFVRWINSPVVRTLMAESAGGTTRQRIAGGRIKELQLPVPPKMEQRRIVTKLDALTTRLARARADLERVAILGRQLRSETLSRSFSDHKTATSLGDLLTRIEAGKNLRCEERPPRAGERGVVKVSAVTWGRFDPQQSKTLPDDYIPPNAAKIRVNDLLISRANTLELVGATVLVEEEPDELYLSDKILRLVMPDADKRWVMWFMRSQAGRREIEERATGNQLSMRNISQGALRAIRIPYPNADVREAGVKTIEAAFARADRVEAEAARARALLDRLEAAILAKAFRGELVPQDPNDEPASVLLDRIRAERAAAPKPKRGRARKAVG